MPIKDVLFPMISYPAPTGPDAVERAVGLAASLGAHLCGLTFELDIRSPVGLYAHPANVGGIFAAERAKSAANARDLIAVFDDLAAKRGVGHERAIEHCPPLEVANLLVAYARLRDLTVFPLKAANHAQRGLVEHLVFESGRPVLLLPEGATRALSSPCDNAVVAWDHTRPAARAVADALPLLQAAKRVHVVTIVDEKRLSRARSGVDLAKHLARHGVEVVFDEVFAKGRSIGDTLEACVVERKADLLVMGAFGHSKMRDFILGGATKSVLSRPATWTLLSH
jgi:nucleotide-binding universal stress UspA family protein